MQANIATTPHRSTCQMRLCRLVSNFLAERITEKDWSEFKVCTDDYWYIVETKKPLPLFFRASAFYKPHFF